ncbi:cation efflux system protein CusF precursor [mine drainage metagenome]|uniref:Cation efflux system protein CusF n=1 Tax=mine drainage metagenome TaxID=410659 RepID=A0A1J5SCW2_9ZZZZ
MKKTISIVSVMTAAALLGISSMTRAQSVDASPRNPMMIADTTMDMKDMNMNGMDMKSMKMERAANSHHGHGTVTKIDASNGMVTFSHEPIATLNWPAMTMSFKLKDAALVNGIKTGDTVDFDLVQSGNDYVVTRLQKSGK